MNRKIILLPLVLSALVLAGCGETGTSSTSSSEETPTSSETTSSSEETPTSSTTSETSEDSTTSEPTLEFTPISDIVESETAVTTRGQVVAKSRQAVIIHDGTAGLYIYGRDYPGTVNVGDYVEAVGSISSYNGLLQMAWNGTVAATITKVSGEIEGTIRHPMGTRIGGMTGWLGNGIIRNCIAKIEITAPDRTGNGGLIGGPQNGNVTVESSVSLSTGANANRISGWNVLGTASSAYELDSSDSQSNINETNADRIFPVSQQQAAEKAFYLETLGWSEAVWDFSALAAGGLPALR